MTLKEAIASLNMDAEHVAMDTGEVELADIAKRFIEAVRVVTDALESPRPDWTPCAEGLPEFTNFYNVTVGVGGMLGYYEETRTYRYLKIKGEEPKWVIPDRFDEVVHVLAWQPLPAPYNPDRKEDAKSDDVSQWPDWKKRAATCNYEFGKDD